METDRRPRRLPDFSGRKKMIEVGVGMEDMRNRQSKLLHLVKNSLVRSTGIDDDRLLRHWIADDRAIATEGRDRKGFSDHGRQHGCMLPSKPIMAQAAALHPAGC